MFFFFNYFDLVTTMLSYTKDPKNASSSSRIFILGYPYLIFRILSITYLYPKNARSGAGKLGYPNFILKILGMLFIHDNLMIIFMILIIFISNCIRT